MTALPPDKEQLIGEILQELTGVRGVVAVVLGGSWARGTLEPDSDIDLGLYYFEPAPFAVPEIRGIAERFSARGPATVTEFYEWGPWVNGGAWIQTRSGKVDFLYRSVEHVRRVIREAGEGKTSSHYFQQPTYGFHSVIYLGETRIAIPLYDPDGIVAALKKEVARYPAPLRKTIVRESLWGAEFTLSFARRFSAKGDVYNTVGCLTRALSHLTQALFAINETYFVNDKGALEAIEGFALRPEGYQATASRILSHPGESAAELSGSVRQLEALFETVRRLAHELYKPKYPL